METPDKKWQTLLKNATDALNQKEIQPSQSGKAREMQRMSEEAFMKIWRSHKSAHD